MNAGWLDPGEHLARTAATAPTGERIGSAKDADADSDLNSCFGEDTAKIATS